MTLVGLNFHKISLDIYVTALEKGPENDLDIAVLYPASETYLCCLGN